MANKALYVTTAGEIRKRLGFPETYSVAEPLTLKRGDLTVLRVGYLNENFVLQTTNGPGSSSAEGLSTYVKVGLKEVGKYDTESFVASGDVVGLDANGFYVIDLNLNNTTLDALLLKDGDDSNDLASVELMFEITWSIGGGGASSTDWQTTSLVHCVIENDVIRTNESDALTAATGLLWQRGFDDATELSPFARTILFDMSSDPTALGSWCMDFNSSYYGATNQQVAKLNSAVNGKAAYGTGQPSDVTDVTSTPNVLNSLGIHCWWDGAKWNLHLYASTSGAWVAGWTSTDAVDLPGDVTTWTADTTTYSGMTDSIGTITHPDPPTDYEVKLPSTFGKHGSRLQFINRNVGFDVTVARGDTSFKLNAGTSISIPDGGTVDLVLNKSSEITTPDWVLGNLDQDFTGDIGWVS